MKTKTRNSQPKARDLFVIAMAIFAVDLSTVAHAQSQRPEGGPPQLDAATQAAVDTCVTENNLPAFGSGVRPTRAQMQTLHECLEAKNISLPRPPHGHHRGQASETPEQQPAPSEEQSSQSAQ
jgi:hypothetical protein